MSRLLIVDNRVLHHLKDSGDLMLLALADPQSLHSLLVHQLEHQILDVVSQLPSISGVKPFLIKEIKMVWAAKALP